MAAAKSPPRPSPRRKPRGVPLPRHGADKPVSPPSLVARQDIRMQLCDTIAACEGLFQQHGPACSCDVCCLVSNMIGCLRVFRMVLEIT